MMKKPLLLFAAFFLLVCASVFFVKVQNNEVFKREDNEEFDYELEKEEWEREAQNEERIREEREKQAMEQEQYMNEWETHSRDKCIKVEQEKNPTKSIAELDDAIEKCVVEVMNGTYEW